MADTQREQLLCVRVGDQEFALSIRAIREIRGWITSTPLPHAPSYIKDMINLRGSVLAIIDLAERLGLPSVPPHGTSVVVVIEHGGGGGGRPVGGGVAPPTPPPQRQAA